MKCIIPATIKDSKGKTTKNNNTKNPTIIPAEVTVKVDKVLTIERVPKNGPKKVIKEVMIKVSIYIAKTEEITKGIIEMVQRYLTEGHTPSPFVFVKSSTGCAKDFPSFLQTPKTSAFNIFPSLPNST